MIVFFFWFCFLLCVQSAVFPGSAIAFGSLSVSCTTDYLSGIHHTYVAGLCFFLLCLAAGFRCSGFREVSGGTGDYCGGEGYCGGGVGGSGTLFSSSIRCLLLRFFNPGE